MVLVDTAGRMQDNAPLMTALAKLIAVNAPDLVLFVGEALVGNEAVDQLVRVFFPERSGRGENLLQQVLSEIWTVAAPQMCSSDPFSPSGQVQQGPG